MPMTWPHQTTGYVRKNTSQMTAIATNAKPRLLARTAATEGPRSACRDSVAVSTIRPFFLPGMPASPFVLPSSVRNDSSYDGRRDLFHLEAQTGYYAQLFKATLEGARLNIGY